MARLMKKADIEELGEINMPQDILNQVVYNAGEDTTADSIVYRRLMNSNTKFTVEVWIMSDNTFGIFSGMFDGMWTINNIGYHGGFHSESEAESYVQLNLQDKAEYNEVVNVQSRLRKNDFMKKQAAGKEPEYEEIAKGFAEKTKIEIPEVEKGHASSLNKYYDGFVSYMEKYYPEWAKYPAFIWSGWGYFVDTFGKDNDEEVQEETTQEPEENEEVETQEVQQVQETQDVPTINDSTMDMGGGDSSN